MRLIDSVPDAAPALVWSTAFIAAVLIGDITNPMPSPMRAKLAARNQSDESMPM
jgi:hypothetical protein